MSKSTSSGDKFLEFFSVTRVFRDQEGRLRTFTSAMEISQWEPYLEVFDKIKIHVRIDESKVLDEGYILEHPRIEFAGIPFYSGIKEFTFKYFKIKSYIRDQISNPKTFYAMWLPSLIGRIVQKSVTKIGAPLMVSVIGDTEAVSKAILPTPINYLAAFYSKKRARAVVSKANAVIYVTLRALQEKYPPHPAAITLARSDVKLPEVPVKREIGSFAIQAESRPMSIIAVGSQQQNYKGHDLLIEAASHLQRQNIPITLTIVGQGSLHEQLISQARDLGLENIEFIKSLGSTAKVAEKLRQHDVYIMPSRTEGMPKALLEALDAGVFSLGSRVGGIPEVLNEACTFEPDSSEAIAECLKHYYLSPKSLGEQFEVQQDMISKFRMHHAGNEILEKFLSNWVNRDSKF